MAHVIWDWNGTLFDDLPIVVRAVNACLRSRGVGEIEVAEYRRRFVRPLNGFYEGLLGHPVDDELLHRLDDVFQEAYWSNIGDAGLNAYAVTAVQRVAANGWTQSIASMLWHDMLVPAVTEFGLHEFMVALDGNRGTAGDTKERHMVEHVGRLRRLFPHLDRERMTVVGDIVDDAVAARAAGVECVLFDGGSQRRADLDGQGVPVVDTLLEAVKSFES